MRPVCLFGRWSQEERGREAGSETGRMEKPLKGELLSRLLLWKLALTHHSPLRNTADGSQNCATGRRGLWIPWLRDAPGWVTHPALLNCAGADLANCHSFKQNSQTGKQRAAWALEAGYCVASSWPSMEPELQSAPFLLCAGLQQSGVSVSHLQSQRIIPNS